GVQSFADVFGSSVVETRLTSACSHRNARHPRCPTFNRDRRGRGHNALQSVLSDAVVATHSSFRFRSPLGDISGVIGRSVRNWSFFCCTISCEKFPSLVALKASRIDHDVKAAKPYDWSSLSARPVLDHVERRLHIGGKRVEGPPIQCRSA